MSHFVTYYDCGRHVMAQCRCMSVEGLAHQRVYSFSKTPCPECPQPNYLPEAQPDGDPGPPSPSDRNYDDG